MNTSSKNRKKSLAQTDVTELLKKAMEQPGVATVMDVYKNSQPILEKFSLLNNQTSHQRWVITGSTTSIG